MPAFAVQPVSVFQGDSTQMQTNAGYFLHTLGVYNNANLPRFCHRQAKGIGAWLFAYSGGKVDWRQMHDAGQKESGKFTSGHNQAFAGTTAQDVLARAPGVYRKFGPDVVYMSYGINNIYHNCPAGTAAAIDAIDAQICDFYNSHGTVVVYVGLPGRAPDGTPCVNPIAGVGWPAGSNAYDVRIELNDFRAARAAASSGMVIYVDIDDIIIDPATGYWRPLMSEDLVHWGAPATQPIAERIWDNVDHLYPDIWPSNPDRDIYAINLDSTAFNELTHHAMTGTGGTAGTGVTGTVPTGWTVERAGAFNVIGGVATPATPAMTGVASIVSVGGFNSIRLTVNPTGGNDYEIFDIKHATVTRPAEPDGTPMWLQGFMSTNAFAGWRGATPSLMAQKAGPQNVYQSQGLSNPRPETFPFNSGGIPMMPFRTHEVLLETNTTQLDPRWRVIVTNQYSPPGSAVFTLQRPKLDFGKHSGLATAI